MSKMNYVSVGETASTEAPVGVHCILEMYECTPALLNDAEYMEAAVAEAARQANSTLLNVHVHEFEPHGVTAIALLAESHLSIHAWPERGYAAVDVFTCGEHCNPEAACMYLVERFHAGRHLLSIIPRGGNISAHLPVEIHSEAVA
jgi:S-adenosylmethionine decarboxylase